MGCHVLFPLLGTSITHSLFASLTYPMRSHTTANLMSLLSSENEVEVPLALLHAAHVSSSHPSYCVCSQVQGSRYVGPLPSHLHPHDAHLAPSFYGEALCIAALTPFLARQKRWSYYRRV